MEIKNAKIDSTTLGFEDHGILTFNLSLNYGGSGQGFGGIALDGKKQEGDTTNYCTKYIKQILQTVGVDRWEDLKGEHIRVKATSTKVHAIGNFLEDKWMEI